MALVFYDDRSAWEEAVSAEGLAFAEENFDSFADGPIPDFTVGADATHEGILFDTQFPTILPVDSGHLLGFRCDGIGWNVHIPGYTSDYYGDIRGVGMDITAAVPAAVPGFFLKIFFNAGPTYIQYDSLGPSFLGVVLDPTDSISGFVWDDPFSNVLSQISGDNLVVAAAPAVVVGGPAPPPAEPIPEPSTLCLFGIGMMGLLVVIINRKRRFAN